MSSSPVLPGSKDYMLVREVTHGGGAMAKPCQRRDNGESKERRPGGHGGWFPVRIAYELSLRHKRGNLEMGLPRPPSPVIRKRREGHGNYPDVWARSLEARNGSGTAASDFAHQPCEHDGSFRYRHQRDRDEKQQGPDGHDDHRTEDEFE